MNDLTHIDKDNNPTMVDVSAKPKVLRKAIASGFIKLSSKTIELIKSNDIKKGNVLLTAELAGIMGGKKTSDLIPLCHNIVIDQVSVKANITERGVEITAHAVCTQSTGIEMEALMAVNIALLTIYDMCKAVDKQMIISDIKLLSKTKENI